MAARNQLMDEEAKKNRADKATPNSPIGEDEGAKDSTLVLLVYFFLLNSPTTSKVLWVFFFLPVFFVSYSFFLQYSYTLICNYSLLFVRILSGQERRRVELIKEKQKRELKQLLQYELSRQRRDEENQRKLELERQADAERKALMKKREKVKRKIHVLFYVHIFIL